MLPRLVSFALSQRLFVVLSVLLLIGAGAVFLPSLPIDAFPDVSPVQVKIIMKAPGLTPEEEFPTNHNRRSSPSAISWRCYKEAGPRQR